MERKSIYDIYEDKFELNLMKLHELSILKVELEKLKSHIDDSLRNSDKTSFLDYSNYFKRVKIRISDLENELT